MLWRIMIYFEEEWIAAENVVGAYFYSGYRGKFSKSEGFSDTYEVEVTEDMVDLQDYVKNLSLNNIREPLGIQSQEDFEMTYAPNIVYIGGKEYVGVGEDD